VKEEMSSKAFYALLCFMEDMMEEFAKNKNLKMIIFTYCQLNKGLNNFKEEKICF